MKSLVLVSLLLLLPVTLSSQDRLSTENPLAQLKDEVQRVVSESGLPFNEEQERAITLMMEDRRKASEDLFGGLMDFSAGPTRGQDADRLNSAIQWMRSEFLGRLQDYLTAEQLTAWSRHQETNAAPATGSRGAGGRANQTQFVRINNNAFTAEDNQYRNRGGGGNFFGGGNNNRGGGGGGDRGGQGGAEVIQRGGAGDWHGTAQILLKDEALNAGRRFASNKPPYQERQLSFEVSGPLIPGRLTSNFGIDQNRSENVDTIRATLADDSIFALGITRPSTFRGINTRHTLQLSDQHSLTIGAGKRRFENENQNVGGFVMPERASDNEGGNWNIDVRQFSAISTRTIYETRVNFNRNGNETVPRTQGVRINVTDAFSSGGAQNKSENRNWNLDFNNLYTRLGETLTIRTGMEGVYRKLRQLQENNFEGTYTFSSLENFRLGKPLSFRMNRGIPLLELGQWEMGFFFQNDVKLSPRLTLMSGVRYEFQTNISDNNNIDPRVGIAYALGRATVIRAGAGLFHQRLPNQLIADQIRLDGEHQYEIVIDNPAYPNPFAGGTVRDSKPSVRVTDPDLATQYGTVAMFSYERTFLTNLFVSAAYDFMRDIHRPRLRNLNAPRDITSPTPASCKPNQSADTCVRPYPDRGNIVNLESTGAETFHTLRLNYRQRMSTVNLSANYTITRNATDTVFLNNNNNNNVSQFGFTSELLPSDSYNLRADWARGAQPLHSLNVNVNYQLPLGLFLTGAMNAMSARRYTVTTGKDDNQDTSVNDRPPGEPRNGRPSPNFLNFDFNISKAFFFGTGAGASRKNVNVFANMTNAFNRPNYSIPSGVMTSPNFQKSTSAGNPREIEVGLRFQF